MQNRFLLLKDYVHIYSKGGLFAKTSFFSIYLFSNLNSSKYYAVPKALVSKLFFLFEMRNNPPAVAFLLYYNIIIKLFLSTLNVRIGNDKILHQSLAIISIAKAKFLLISSIGIFLRKILNLIF